MSKKEEEYKKYILTILDRYANGEASEEDIRELDEWYANFSSDKKYAEGMSPSEKKSRQEGILNNINKKIEEDAPQSRKSRRRIYVTATAAVALILSVFGVLRYNNSWRIAEDPNQLVHAQPSVIEPGSNKAILTLADGSRISLTDAHEGDITQQAGTTVTKTADGELVYLATGQEQPHRNIVYNTIETPNGGQYRVRLPDGTIVWLNAASKLQYPASFKGSSLRKVQLWGEAYFEVAPNKAQPFVVSSDQQEIQVLGTHFNVSAYKEDGAVRTTLIEGSVSVSVSYDPQIQLVLKPGQQAVNNGRNIHAQEANVDYVMAWKEGYFRFDGKTLGDAMNEIARWYDVKIDYQKPALKKELLAGTIGRYKSITQVLRKMELTGAFHFAIDGRQVIVK